VEEELHTFLTLVLDGGEWSASHTMAALLHRENTMVPKAPE